MYVYVYVGINVLICIIRMYEKLLKSYLFFVKVMKVPPVPSVQNLMQPWASRQKNLSDSALAGLLISVCTHMYFLDN